MSKKLLITGNGLDLALGFPTSYSALKDSMELKNWYFCKQKNLYENKYLKHFNLSKLEYSNFSSFLNSFEKHYSIKKEEIWSNLEHKIVEFLKHSVDIAGKNRIKVLDDGYFVFSKIIQSYYVYEVYKKIAKILSENEISKICVKAFYSFLLKTNSLNVTLNYTDFFVYVRMINGNSTIAKLNDINFMFPHLITIINQFISQITSNEVPFDVLDINNYIVENIPKTDLIKDHNKYIKKMGSIIENSPAGVNELDLLKINHFTGKHANPLFIIFGSSNPKFEYNKKYSNLSKNANKNLSLLNYPLQNAIEISKVNIDEVYVIGYSFGEEDRLINDVIVEKICKTKKLKILYFKTKSKESSFDEEKDFFALKSLINKKIIEFLQRNHKKLNINNIDEFVTEIKIEKKLIDNNGYLVD